jgi:hypothetical protein
MGASFPVRGRAGGSLLPGQGQWRLLPRQALLWSGGAGSGGAGWDLVAVAAGLLAGQLGLPESGEPVQGVGDGAGGPAQDPADLVRAEVAVGV